MGYNISFATSKLRKYASYAVKIVIKKWAYMYVDGYRLFKIGNLIKVLKKLINLIVL